MEAAASLTDSEGDQAEADSEALVESEEASSALTPPLLPPQVSTSQADALARRDCKFDAIQQRRAAECQCDVFQLDKGRRHIAEYS